LVKLEYLCSAKVVLIGIIYKPVTVGTVAIGIRKSDAELLAKINASLAKLKANGTIAKILGKWGQKADAS